MKHDQRFEKLKELNDYELVNESQDIRGLPLVAENGKSFGKIKDLLVNDSREQVVAIRLEDGRTCSVDPLEIHENAVVYGAAANDYAEKVSNEEASSSVIQQEVIPVVEETVTIGKRVADHGKGILVKTHTVSDTVAEDVALRNETVSVETHKVDKAVSKENAEAIFGQGESQVDMTERHEEVVITKDAVQTDEVVLKKTANDKVKHVTETARRTEVEVEEVN